MKPGKNPINAKFRIENYVTGEAGPPDEGDALQRLAQSHFVGQDGAVHVGHREAHDAAVEEEDALALVRPQVFAQQRVDHHVHQHRAGVALLPLTKTKKKQNVGPVITSKTTRATKPFDSNIASGSESTLFSDVVLL